MKSGYVYIMANHKNGTLYIGVTSDIIKRVYEHKNSFVEGFTSTYSVEKLVYFEVFDDIVNAIAREKTLKKWNRDWKIILIEKMNPNWDDLYESLF